MKTKEEKKELLTKREEQRKKRPSFIRHAAHRKSKLEEKWRRPKGLHNKLRLSKKSRGSAVKTGYGSPAAIRGKSASGKRMLVVENRTQLHMTEPESHELIIASGLGDRKRLALLQEAQKHGFTILNLDLKASVDAIEKRFAVRKEARASRVSKQAERDKKIEKKAKDEKKAEKEKVEKKEAEKAAAKTSDDKVKAADEKKKEELKEQQKILTKKE